MRKIRVALAGNPNAGKTSVFNALTGSSQHVGNYPGVTVDTVVGTRRHRGCEITFIDLPGSYSLTAHSDDEREARRILLHNPPDLVVNVVDATNLERNLYLTVQLMELGYPLVIALNMSDEARSQGVMADTEVLEEILGAEVVPTVGHRGSGTGELLDRIVDGCEAGHEPRRVRFGRDIDPLLDSMARNIAEAGEDLYPPRYAAAKLLEDDPEVIAHLRGSLPTEEMEALEATSRAARKHLEDIFGDPAEVVLAELRHGMASGAWKEATPSRSSRSTTPTTTHRIDNVLLNRVFGLPLFALAMYLTFWLTFTVGSPLAGLLESLFGTMAGALQSWLPPGLIRSMLVDGIIGGVGGVLVFVPNIALLFLAISVMEDTGYMARVAFLMDRFMHKIGLHGQSFIPMIIGFGCTVPGVMATRVLSNRRDRLATILVLPLMSCSAKLPVYLLVAGAFFPGQRALVLWLVYLGGIVLAVILAKLLRVSVLRGENSPFVMELPPYRLPTVRGILQHVWFRARHYVAKAGTIILAFSIVLWFLSSYPKPEEHRVDGLVDSGRLTVVEEDGEVHALRLEGGEEVEGTIDRGELTAARKAEEMEHSLAGRIGRSLEPAMRPLGFDWRISTALVGALGAKEIFVSQMGILFSLGSSEASVSRLESILTHRYTARTGISILIFVLVMAPCIATFAIVRRETGSWAIAAAQFAGLTILAYLLSLAYYQISGVLA
jgi:ferrous iron transport protein B